MAGLRARPARPVTCPADDRSNAAAGAAPTTYRWGRHPPATARRSDLHAPHLTAAVDAGDAEAGRRRDRVRRDVQVPAVDRETRRERNPDLGPGAVRCEPDHGAGEQLAGIDRTVRTHGHTVRRAQARE